MDHARSPLAIASDVFAALICEPDPLALDAAEVGLGPRGESIEVGRLRDLLREPSTPNAVKNQSWRALVARAQSHGGAWTVAAVGVALGPLVALATSLANGGELARPDLDAEVLAGFLAGLTAADPAADGLFPELMRAAKERGLAWVRHLRAADTPLCEMEHHRSAPPRPPWGHPDLVLASAVEAGVITRAEAELIGATRLDSIPVAEIAARQGVSAKAITMRRSRAEKRLVAALRAARCGDDERDHDPTLTQALDAAGLISRVRITRALRAPRQRGEPNAQTPSGGRTHDQSRRADRDKVCGNPRRRLPSSQQEGPRPHPPASPTASPGTRRTRRKAA